MSNKLSKIMTVCGLIAMVFYTIMLSAGSFSWEVMPQFTVASLIFLCSGHVMKKIARHLRQRTMKQQATTLDWQLSLWVFGMVVLMILALLLLVPVGGSLADTCLFRLSHQLCNSSWIP